MEIIMIKFVKITFALIMTALIIVCASLPAFAASDKLDVNGAKAEKGDKVSFSLNLGDCEEKLEGLQMCVCYDSNYLSLDADSVEFPSLSNVVSNTKEKGSISFNWTDVTNLVSFKKTASLIKADFKVLKAGETSITYFVTEMYGNDLTYLKKFTLTNDISVNGKKAVKGKTAILNESSIVANANQGSFTNYKDGKGEKNGSGPDHVAVTGVPDPQVTETTIDVTKGSSNITTIITILRIVAVVIAIVIVVILRNHFSSDDKKTDK